MKVRDTIISSVDMNIPFWERFRLVFVGKFRIENKIECENLPGQVRGEFKYIALRMFPTKATGLVCGEAPAKEK